MMVYVVKFNWRGTEVLYDKIISIHKSITAATNKAMQVPCNYKGGWIRDKKHPYLWSNECDFVEILQFELLK